MKSSLSLLLFAALVGSAHSQTPAEKPQYGGALTVANVYYTVTPLSFDVADWPWKFNQDVGLTYEQLFAGDLSKAKRNGGKYNFRPDAFFAPDALRGELAESWKLLQNPWRVEVQLRKGVMWPAKPGVMESREFTSEDVVYSYDRVNKSPKKIVGYFDHIAKVEASGKYAVTFTFKEYNAEWDYRFGWGYYSAIMPKEVVTAGANNWRHANGTGPFLLSDYVTGNALTFTKNPVYWDKETIAGQPYKLPFVDKVTYRVIKDEATMLSQLRTGKLDIVEAIKWSAIDELKKSAPKLVVARGLQGGGTFIGLRTDIKPFDDIRVRRALNMAINKQEIIKGYYAGNAEMFAYPQLPEYIGYYEPLADMPDSVKELFKYDPVKARKLLDEAGVPKGFKFKVQMSSSSTDGDLLQLISAYLEKVGITMEIQVMDYGAYLSAMTTHTNAPGYFAFVGAGNPTAGMRKSFMAKQTWNISMFNEPEFDKKMGEVYSEPDERVRQVKMRLLTREIVEKAPYIWLPSQYNYAAWWPWVKNYGGELRAGADRPGPIHARVWIDQELKKKMGY